MMTLNGMTAAANNDAELVCETLAGNRDAFAQIVSRYQSLICSLAYSATGRLGLAKYPNDPTLQGKINAR